MLIEKPKVFISPEFLIRQASQPWERVGSSELRHRTFVAEQGIFAHHDRDEIDNVMMPIVAVSTVASEAYEVVGTVRIHQPEKGVWWGSRLSVAQNYRKVGRLGPELIRFAVGTALHYGCDLFLAHVQLRNVPLFKKLNWEELESVELFGQTHVKMRANLQAFGIVPNPYRGWITLNKKRAA
jgi:putative N-acetyltransferase (TIGR04045 family)